MPNTRKLHQNNTIAEVIHSILLRENIKVTVLAKDIRCDYQTLNRMISGKTKLSAQVADDILAHLGYRLIAIPQELLDK